MNMRLLAILGALAAAVVWGYAASCFGNGLVLIVPFTA